MADVHGESAANSGVASDYNIDEAGGTNSRQCFGKHVVSIKVRNNIYICMFIWCIKWPTLDHHLISDILWRCLYDVYAIDMTCLFNTEFYSYVLGLHCALCLQVGTSLMRFIKGKGYIDSVVASNDYFKCHIFNIFSAEEWLRRCLKRKWESKLNFHFLRKKNLSVR